jgi:membrane-associated phospholipid phosphatase
VVSEFCDFSLRLKSFFAGLLILSGIGYAQAQGQLSNLDKNAFMEVQGWRSAGTDEFFGHYSNSVLPVALLVPAGIYGFSKIGLLPDTSLMSTVLKTTIVAGSGFLVARGLKELIQRPRPFATLNGVNPVLPLPDPLSMPSGHTSVAFSTAVGLSLEYPRWEVVAPSLLWAGGVGFSRIILGHHYPGDVLAGALVGAGTAWLGHQLSLKIKKKKIRLPFRKPD